LLFKIPKKNKKQKGEREMEEILIIGSGIVGTATGKGLSSLGHKVTFVDIKPEVLQRLKNEGCTAIGLDRFDEINVDISMLCLPTPTVNNRIDISAYEVILPKLGKKLSFSKDYHLIVVRSTILPGVTEGLIIPRLEQISGKKAGIDFGICVNPEFLREATAEKDFLNPWILLIGALDQKSGSFLENLYKPIVQKRDIPIMKTDLKTAEMIKYVHNLYNATKISFANEIWTVSKELGIDGNFVMEVVAKSAEGMWNLKYGIRGGYPFGGSCLPKDTQAFLNFAEENGQEMKLLKAVIDINKKLEWLLGITQTDVGKRK
jgi:UDPglucose 6-dehydrogenase